MAKTHPQFQPLLYVIIARNADGLKVGSLGSYDDIEKTKRNAQGMMRLIPAATYADIHTYVGVGEAAKGKYEGDPLERVTREEQGGAR